MLPGFPYLLEVVAAERFSKDISLILQLDKKEIENKTILKERELCICLYHSK